MPTVKLRIVEIEGNLPDGEPPEFLSGEAFPRQTAAAETAAAPPSRGLAEAVAADDPIAPHPRHKPAEPFPALQPWNGAEPQPPGDGLVQSVQRMSGDHLSIAEGIRKALRAQTGGSSCTPAAIHAWLQSHGHRHIELTQITSNLYALRQKGQVERDPATMGADIAWRLTEQTG